MYKVTGYNDGIAVATGQYDDLHEAITKAADAMFSARGPAIDEIEIETTLNKRSTLVAYFMNNEDGLRRGGFA